MSSAGTGRTLMIESLMEPAAYLHPVSGKIERISTHISDVFLAGEFAYKVKKPVNFGFCDFSTPELRRRFSERELELNQRLSSGVYLSVEPVTFKESDGAQPARFSIDGDGEVVESALKMRRLNDSDRLDRLIESGDAGEPEIRRIASLLAEFHASAPVAPAGFATLDAVREIVLGNLERVNEHAPAELQDAALANVAGFATAFLGERGELFRRRRAADRPRRCHGDLHAGNIFLENSGDGEPSIQVIDCIEFNDNLINIDPAADIAFLSMDLKRRERPDLASLLIDTYVAAAGDTGIYALLPFYESYRAMVRCLAASISAEQAGRESRDSHVEDANPYLELASRIAADSLPQFVLITSGVTGTGKSTVAKLIAEHWRAEHLQTDAIRRELAGLGPVERSGSPVRGGIYTPEMSRRTYEEMHRRAEAALAAGRPVIMDGTHLRRDFRRTSLDIGRRAGVMTMVVECSLSGSEAKARLEERYAGGRSESEGRPEVHAQQMKSWQPVADDEADAVAHVDTGGALNELPAKVFAAVWGTVLKSSDNSGEHGT